MERLKNSRLKEAFELKQLYESNIENLYREIEMVLEKYRITKKIIAEKLGITSSKFIYSFSKRNFTEEELKKIVKIINSLD